MTNFLQKLKLWQKIILSFLLLGILCFAIILLLFNDNIVGTVCVNENDCPEEYVCYRADEGPRLFDCNKIKCVCHKQCNNILDCSYKKPFCGPMAWTNTDYVGLCFK